MCGPAGSSASVADGIAQAMADARRVRASLAADAEVAACAEVTLTRSRNLASP
jgi:hypothetical protein